MAGDLRCGFYRRASRGHQREAPSLLLVHDLPHVGDIDAMGIKPPFRIHIGMPVPETQIFAAKSHLAFDLFFKVGMIQRATHDVDAAK